MLSNRPYLLRAFYEWIVDSELTPILVLEANHPRLKAPQDFAEDGEIVFNISASAIRDLKMTNDFVEFKAAFSGVIHFIHAPIGAILAIYAEENGEGIFFDADEDLGGAQSSITPLKALKNINSDMTPPEVLSKSNVKPFLKLVE